MDTTPTRRVLDDLFHILLRFDFFGKPLPAFNMQGKTEIRTGVGALFSLSMMAILVLFSLLKMSHLIERRNPVVNTFELMNEIGREDPFEPHESRFAMAVAI